MRRECGRRSLACFSQGNGPSAGRLLLLVFRQELCDQLGVLNGQVQVPVGRVARFQVLLEVVHNAERVDRQGGREEFEPAGARPQRLRVRRQQDVGRSGRPQEMDGRKQLSQHAENRVLFQRRKLERLRLLLGPHQANPAAPRLRQLGHRHQRLGHLLRSRQAQAVANGGHAYQPAQIPLLAGIHSLHAYTVLRSSQEDIRQPLSLGAD